MESMLLLLPMVWDTIFSLVFKPLESGPIFWIMVLFIAFQYRRLAEMKARLYGVQGESVIRPVLIATAMGIGGGVLGSMLMVLFGITFSGSGVGYLLPLALFLMLFHMRFMCFAYAGGILSLTNYFLGVPEINIPQILGLVAILHMVESLLILTGGHLGALPIYTRNRRGEVVGGFNLQSLWPIPVVALMTFSVETQGILEQSMQMPEWWPLIKPGNLPDSANLVYTLFPVVAALGYGDLALTAPPQKKTRRSALYLGLYSLTLLGLALVASYYPWLAVLPALFSPLGHEYIIRLGQRAELDGKPLFVPPATGIRVLDVISGSPAHQAGLVSGDIIVAVNDIEIYDRNQLAWALAEAGPSVVLDCLTGKSNALRRVRLRRPSAQSLGVIPVPEPMDRPHVEFAEKGLLGRLWGRRKGRRA